MPRLVRLAAGALLLAAACERAAVRVEPAAIAAFEGVRTVVHVEAELGCDDPDDPVLEPADGSSLSPVAAEVRRLPKPTDGGSYYIGNPGMVGDIYLPDGSFAGGSEYLDPYDPATTRVVSTGGGLPLALKGRRFAVLVQPADGLGPGVRPLRVKVRGCGTAASAELTVTVLGRLELGGFCGITDGASCADDAGCERAGCGELCAAAGSSAAGPSLCLGSDCTDPVPSGATCGCVSGACAWRLP